MSCIPGECLNYRIMGEIPTLSCSLGLNSAMQSRAGKTEVNKMALSQITIQCTEESISKEVKSLVSSSIYFI